MIEGELEVTIASAGKRIGPGFVVIVPPDTKHEVRVLTAGKAIVVDYPLRKMR